MINSNNYNVYSDAVVLFRPKVMSNKFEEDSVVYSASADTDGLNKFITAN